MRQLEFFFDFSSPWSYMAFARVETLCAETDAELIWKPFYVAAVFRTVNHNVADMRRNPVEAKQSYYWTDMRRWAARLGITIARPPVYGGGSRPLNSARALRGALLAIDDGRIGEYARAVFHTYWEALRDVSDMDVLCDVATGCGLDPEAFRTRVDSDDCRKRLKANTDELIARGGFGTPTFFVDREAMFFGNDRLDFVREALSGQSLRTD